MVIRGRTAKQRFFYLSFFKAVFPEGEGIPLETCSVAVLSGILFFWKAEATYWRGASLIASTGNITGPAAPASSQIQPDVKRPGYHLSRYSLESRFPTVKHHHDKDKDAQRCSIEMIPIRPKSDSFEHVPSFAPSFPNSPSNETLTTLTELQHHDKTHEKKPSTSSLRNRWSVILRDFPYTSPVRSLGRTPAQTPLTATATEGEDDYFSTGDRDKEKRKARFRIHFLLQLNSLYKIVVH